MDRTEFALAVESFAVLLPARLLVGSTLAGVLALGVDVFASASVGVAVGAVLVSPFALAAVGFRPTLPTAVAHFLLAGVLGAAVSVALAAVAPDAALFFAYAPAVALSWALVFTEAGRDVRKRASRKVQTGLRALRDG